MSGLQLVQTLNSTPFVLLWLFHCGSWDISFLRKGLGVIKAVRTRNCRSLPMPLQYWRDRTGGLQSVPDWWGGEIKRKSRVWKWNTPMLLWPGCIPSEQVCRWKGETARYQSRDEASMSKGKLFVRLQHKGIQGRGTQWDVPAPSSQHKPSEGASCHSLGCANKQMRCLIEASSTTGRSTRGTCQTASGFVLIWEMGQHLCMATNPFCVTWGDGNYGQAFTLSGARSRVMPSECRRCLVWVMLCLQDPWLRGTVRVKIKMSTKAIPLKLVF